MEGIRVVAAPRPFSNIQKRSLAPVGSTLLSIVNETVPQRYMGVVDCTVFIEGNFIRRDVWHLVRPKPGTLVNIRVVPTGGGGKNPLATILSIAVIVAAPYLGAAALTAIAPIGAGITTTAAVIGGVTVTSSLVGGVISAVGLMAISALAGPPKQSYAGRGSPAESPTLFIEGARNSLNPYGVIPACLGTNRMFMPQCATPFTETQDDDQYVRQLFTYGFGKVSRTDTKIGDTSISSFTDFEIDYLLDANLNSGTDIYSNAVQQVQYQVLLKEVDSWTERAVPLNRDEAIIDIVFSRGLTRFNSNGKRVNQSVVLEVEWRAVGDMSWTPLSDPNLTITNATAEAFVRSYRIVFPARGDYEVRVRRVTEDHDDDTSENRRIMDLATLSSIRGVRYVNPVRAANISGVGVRIKASDQLNGALDQFNEIVSSIIPDYDVGTDTWIERATSNPASIYRYILQGAPNARPLDDGEIDIMALQEWHVYCASRGYTCDIVIDYDASVDDTLRLVATAGSASPEIVDGKRTVIVDRAGKDIAQSVTPRNSWGYSGEMIYPKLPHAFRVTFRNKNKGYLMDERIVYADGYDEGNATLFETLELRHTTTPELAWKHGRRYLATAKLRPESHSFNMAVENIIFIRGDRIKFEHDVPLIGLGDGRIKNITLNNDGDVESLDVDDIISIPSGGDSIFARIRLSDGTQLYRQLSNPAGNTQTLYFSEPIAIGDSPAVGDLLYVAKGGGELDLVVTRIEPGEDLSAKITCLNYAPEIFDAEDGTIPPFNSNITIPFDLQRPLPPILVSAQSDERVQIRNIDGSFTSRAVIDLRNDNIGDVEVSVKVRYQGASSFEPAKLLEAGNSRVVITGLDDGMRYDIHIQYRRLGGSVYSVPLQLNGYTFVGLSGPPSDVENFRVSVADNAGFFTWDGVEDIDISHYVIRFSSLISGASWGTSQVVEDNILDTRVSIPVQQGTYFIKAVDFDGRESVNAATIITSGLDVALNVIEHLQEEPGFSGSHDNTAVNNNELILADPTQEGIYDFDQIVDLTAVFPAFISSEIRASGKFQNNIFDMDDIFAVENIFGGGNNIFDMDDIFAVEDIFGIGTDGWSVSLEMSFTDDDPGGSPVWTDWEPFISGSHVFRAARFRLRMSSTETGVTPSVSILRVKIDMPDRIDRGEDLTVPVGGTTISFVPAFKNVPALSILLQDADVQDVIELVSKDEEGFEFKVYNTGVSGYVERTYDFIASGYGRVM